MSKWFLAIAISLLGTMIVATDADARRFGGARSVGTQRNVTAPPAKPAQQQQANQGQQQGQQAAPAAGGSRWGGILGGLALGGLLGYLFAGNGMMGVLLLALLAIAAVAVIRALMQRRGESARPVQLAGMRQTVDVAPPPAGGQSLTLKTRLPAGFDSTGFLRAAKVNFLKLQAANDAGRLDEIREFTTEELFDALKGEAGGRNETEVTGLDAELLELSTEGAEHWASVRFSGQVREAPGAAPEGFSEDWNLVKPADGSSGWLLAGIQQMH